MARVSGSGLLATVGRSIGDGAGLLLASGLVAWTSLSALATDGEGRDAAAVAATVALAAVAYTLGRAVGTRVRWLVPAAVAGAVLAATLADRLSVPGGRPGVLGYSNASAQLDVQGFAAALVVVAVVGLRAWSIPAVIAALALAAATIRSDSVAASLLLTLPAAALMVALLGRPSRALLAGLGGLVVAAIVGTIILGAFDEVPGDDEFADPLIEATLSGRRIDLWHDALLMTVEHPIVGVGPGRFQVESPTARADVDARWAHHGFLQMAAETGVPGFVLLAGLFGWGFVRLGLVEGPDGPALVAGAALAALGIHACVDYVLHFPVLSIATSAVVGAAASRPSTMQLEEGGR